LRQEDCKFNASLGYTVKFQLEEKEAEEEEHIK
jgi:hypothetical protein